MQSDLVDQYMAQWRKQRPELDTSSLGVISRILMLYKYLEQSADASLSRFGLTLWQLDVLTALRRSGPPFALSPTQLMELVTLSSGAMTNRIDRLEALGLVRRDPDPKDRRGVLISLTPEGLRLVDEAITVRLDEARERLGVYSDGEAELLAGLLRKLLVSLESASRNGASQRRSRVTPGI